MNVRSLGNITLLMTVLLPCTTAAQALPDSVAQLNAARALLATARFMLVEQDSITAMDRPTAKTLLAKRPGRVVLVVAPHPAPSTMARVPYRDPSSPGVSDHLAQITLRIVDSLRRDGVPVDAGVIVRHAATGSPVPRSTGLDVQRADGNKVAECKLVLIPRASRTECVMSDDTVLFVRLYYPLARPMGLSIDMDVYPDVQGEPARAANSHFSVHADEASGSWKVSRVGSIILR